jgi:iron(II)-dependent oxidoreductase
MSAHAPLLAPTRRAEPLPAREAIVERLTEARARTLLLIAPLSEAELAAQHDPLLSPIVWDLGHIARFEELWLLGNLRGEIRFGEMPGLYNPFEHPRAERGRLPLPSLAGTLELMAAVRRRVLQSLDAIDLDAANPLLAGGLVYQMVLQHEYQHDETILQALQIKCGAPYRAPRALEPPPAAPLPAGEMVRFPGAVVEMGTDDASETYDNERPRHAVELPPFWIDRAPVSNAAYLGFMEDGGYTRRELWSDAGWAWLAEEGAQAPKYWEQRADGWWVRRFGHAAPVAPDHPVCHVCWHEAEAYARWAGKRLPSEAEWEAACRFDPATGAMRRYPWGDVPPTVADANLDQLMFGTAPIGAYPRNLSPIGCYGMIGDVWEWTASTFHGYPGFRSFPYPEYSEVFFGEEYRVLRGGSFATRPGVARSTFRNWDYPIRRQIFSGFRCARDA